MNTKWALMVLFFMVNLFFVALLAAAPLDQLREM